MYNSTFWKDHVTEPGNTFHLQKNGDGTYTLIPAGNVIQQGTNMNAENFNNMEGGIFDANLASKLVVIALRDILDRANLAAIPQITISDITDGHAVTITDSDGKTTTFSVMDGTDGTPGAPGAMGPKGDAGVGISSIEQTTTSTADGGTNVITVTLTDGTKYTFNVKNGSKGSTGATGATGATGPQGTSGATAFTYGTTDLTAGSSSLETGKLYFVYE